jgi:hypothetical protein
MKSFCCLFGARPFSTYFSKYLNIDCGILSYLTYSWLYQLFISIFFVFFYVYLLQNTQGTIKIGAFLREFKESDLNQRSDGSDENGDDDEEAVLEETQKFQLYCQIVHARDISSQGTSGTLGRYTPFLHWMNRVKLKVDDLGVYSSYVYKTTGPEWNEILSMEVRVFFLFFNFYFFF